MKTARRKNFRNWGKSHCNYLMRNSGRTTKKNPTSSVCREKCRIIKNNKRKITSVSLASSTNVDYYTADGYSFARISCGYTMTENGKKSSTVMVYLLRRDDNRRWKIYGWETADQLNSKQEQTDNN
jgi:hypothetical protein